MKKLIIAVVILLGIYFFIARAAELQNIWSVLQEGEFIWLGLGIALLGLWILNQAASFQTLFSLVGIQQKLLRISRLFLAVNFVNLVAPSAGISGMAVFFTEAQKNGHSTARVTVASVLFLLFDYLGLLMIILAGMIILAFNNNLHFTEVIAYILFVLLAAGLSGLLIVGARSDQKLARILRWLSFHINKLTRWINKKEILPETKAVEFAEELSDGLKTLKEVRRGWIKPALLSLSNKALLILILGVVFLAFNVGFNMDILIAGFSIAYLFIIISPTPAGVGIMEGILAISLNSLGVPLDAAAVITLAFRAITFWLPLLLGMISFRTLHP